MKKDIFIIIPILLTSCTININYNPLSSENLSYSSFISSEENNSSLSSISTSEEQSSNESITTSEEYSTSVDLSSETSTSSMSSSSTLSSSSEEVCIEDNLDDSEDPYVDVNRNDFYANYSIATSYKDAYFRTKHGLMSGSIDLKVGDHLPKGENLPYRDDNGKYIKISDGKYTYRCDDSYESYTINNTSTTLYYGGAYITLEEVAAYIQAFGKVPPNNNYDKGSSGKKEAIDTWGEYGRVNVGVFSGDTSKYPTEPELPELSTKTYIETDIGSLGGFDCGGTVSVYNNGNNISRGVCRIVFTSSYKNGSKISDISERHVFYTYNHYNDFQEYLNYYQGWGLRFGNESAGNDYNVENSSNPPTSYPNVVLKKLSEVL